MKNKNQIYIGIGLIIVLAMMGYLLYSCFGSNSTDISVDKAEKGTIGAGTVTVGDETEEDTGADALERNPEMRVTFLDRYMLGDVIPPECMPNVCGIMQQWLDKAFENDKLNYTITLDENSIEQNDMYAAFGFHVTEFPEYDFRYAHYYGSNEVIITSPQFEKLRFPRDE